VIAAPKTLHIRVGSRWQSKECQDQQSNGAKFVGAALYQLVVPLEQTFGTRPVVVERKARWRHAHKRRHRTS